MIDGASTTAEMYLEGYCRGPMLRISKTSLVDGASTLVETYLEGLFHLDLEYFSNIPLVSGASVIVEMYLDGFAATVCVVFFKFIICKRHISLRNCIMKVVSR